MDKVNFLQLLINQLNEVESTLKDIKSNIHRDITEKEATLELTKSNILLGISNFSETNLIHAQRKGDLE